VSARRLLVALAVFLSAAGLAVPAHAAFPGQNGKIAYGLFDCFVTGCSSDLYVIEPDGSGRTALTDTPTENDIEPAWSADGSKLAFSSNRDGNYEIYVVDADGTNPRTLTAHPARDSRPAWSPDGSRIAFESNRGGGATGIYVMDADGSNPVLLQPQAGHPSWSPDGSKIAFSDGSIWVMSADGAGKQLIRERGTAFDSCAGLVPFSYFGPDWSPDGEWLAYVSQTYDGCMEQFVYFFETVNLSQGAGGTFFDTVEGCGPSPPAWSPDGSKIALSGDPSSDCSLIVVNRDGSGARSIGPDRFGPDAPDWQPIVGPRRSDYKNASKFCKAEREFLGEDTFRERYGGGANAHGKCVSRN
jgi:Tol biopolymer transport system component